MDDSHYKSEFCSLYDMILKDQIKLSPYLMLSDYLAQKRGNRVKLDAEFDSDYVVS